MTDDLGTWEDYDTHIMQMHKTRNDYFHASADCPRIKHPERSVDRSEHYLAYHEPEPCGSCHEPAMPEVVADGGDRQVRVAVPRADSDGECYHAPGGPCGSHLLRNVETTIGELYSAGLHPCSNCVHKHGLETLDGDEEVRTDGSGQKMVKSCPKCGSEHILNISGFFKYPDSDGNNAWKCRKPGCYATFDKPKLCPKETDKHRCPNCGDWFGNLPQHLRSCTDGGSE